MRPDDVFRVMCGGPLFPWRLKLGAGAALCLAAVAVVLYPLLLVFVIAGLLGSAGLALVGSAVRSRRRERTTPGNWQAGGVQFRRPGD